MDLADALDLAGEDRAEVRASEPFELTPVIFEVEVEGDEDEAGAASAVLVLPRERSEYGEAEEARGEALLEPLALAVVFCRLLLDSPADAGEAVVAVLLEAALRFLYSLEM